MDKLAGSGSALGDSKTDYYPGVQADYNQNIVADPKNRQHVYLQLEEVFESTDGGGDLGHRRPLLELRHRLQPGRQTPYACPPTTHPDQHAGDDLRGQFWAGSDGGVWRGR